MSVTTRFHERVALVTLDDGKANAFGPATLQALEAALDEVEASDAGAVVFAGRAGFFSGGLDLKALPAMAPEARTATFDHFSRLMLRAWTLDRPTVAAVTGHALGGGAIFALAADVRLGVEAAAKIGLIEVAVGLPVPGFAVEMARGALTGSTLVQSVIHGRAWTMPEAREAGWLESLHSADTLIDAACARAALLAMIQRAPYATTKAHLHAAERARADLMRDADVASFIAAFDARR